MTANLIAFLWGFAEATLFFIVPDVAISIIALEGSELGLTAAFYALAGALTGGTIMYFWGKGEIERVSQILQRIPAIRPKDIEKVKADLEKTGAAAILFGPILGIPYKIYAAYAHVITTFITFLLISIPARGVRFFLVPLFTAYAFERFLPTTPYTLQVQILLVLWVVFYGLYFVIKSK